MKIQWSNSIKTIALVMTKKLLLTVIGLMLLALPLGCVISDVPLGTDLALGAEGVVPNDEEANDILASLDEEDLAMPDDFLDGFYIIYESRQVL
ncbi:MAG: hypothetical protein FWE97_01115 [Dehalococcoidia bacterium]|nr:hypothetical protein [Dehalococcoidia bacterium]